MIRKKRNTSVGIDRPITAQEFAAPIDADSAANLLIAVIHQALSDATLGISKTLVAQSNAQHNGDQKRIKHGPKKPIIPARGSSSLNPLDVHSARTFIKGRDGALLDYCNALGPDYQETRKALLTVYYAAQPYLPPEWRDHDALDA